MKNAKLILGAIGIAAVAFIGLVVFLKVSDAKAETEKEKALEEAKENMEVALSQNDFAKARAAAKVLDDEDTYRNNENAQRITDAEIGYLANEGEFDMAYQIATENDLPDAYYNKVVPNLVSIYTKYGANKTILALSSCVLPIRGKRWGKQYFSDDEFYAQKWNDFNVKHNKNIERLMNYMKLSDDKDNISKVALFLTTEYPNGTKDVNAIKAKFGL